MVLLREGPSGEFSFDDVAQNVLDVEPGCPDLLRNEAAVIPGVVLISSRLICSLPGVPLRI